LHGLRVITYEDAGLAIGIVEIGLSIWAVEELAYEFAGKLWIRGYGDLKGIDDWIFKGCDLADEVLG
jgi:hypothetical protein